MKTTHFFLVRINSWTEVAVTTTTKPKHNCWFSDEMNPRKTSAF